MLLEIIHFLLIFFVFFILLVFFIVKVLVIFIVIIEFLVLDDDLGDVSFVIRHLLSLDGGLVGLEVSLGVGLGGFLVPRLSLDGRALEGLRVVGSGEFDQLISLVDGLLLEFGDLLHRLGLEELVLWQRKVDGHGPSKKPESVGFFNRLGGAVHALELDKGKALAGALSILGDMDVSDGSMGPKDLAEFLLGDTKGEVSHDQTRSLGDLGHQLGLEGAAPDLGLFEESDGLKGLLGRGHEESGGDVVFIVIRGFVVLLFFQRHLGAVQVLLLQDPPDVLLLDKVVHLLDQDQTLRVQSGGLLGLLGVVLVVVFITVVVIIIRGNLFGGFLLLFLFLLHLFFLDRFFLLLLFFFRLLLFLLLGVLVVAVLVGTAVALFEGLLELGHGLLVLAIRKVVVVKVVAEVETDTRLDVVRVLSAWLKLGQIELLSLECTEFLEFSLFLLFTVELFLFLIFFFVFAFFLLDLLLLVLLVALLVGLLVVFVVARVLLSKLDDLVQRRSRGALGGLGGAFSTALETFLLGGTLLGPVQQEQFVGSDRLSLELEEGVLGVLIDGKLDVSIASASGFVLLLDDKGPFDGTDVLKELLELLVVKGLGQVPHK
mmetsp:Transcript_43567/g.72556  ORF Transcript_43567/g.72556 Transcript_43567/m.72556 type:complete len:600 (-) Transcript_43567:132-1931(-)